MTRSIASLAALALAAALFVVGSPADAAPTAVRNVRRSGFVNPGTRFSVKAPCPRGFKVMSGGVAVEGGDPLTTVGGSAPYDNADRGKVPQDGWIGTINNQGTQRRKMTTHAICSRGEALTYVSQSGNLGPGPFTVTLPCPADRSVVGGGVRIATTSPFMEIQGNAPFDGDVEADDEPDDSWRTTVFNDTPENTVLTQYAVCAPAGPYTYRVATLTLPPDTPIAAVSLACQLSDRVVGGGGEAGPTLRIQSTFPTDASGDGIADNAWAHTVLNSSAAPVDVTVHAICLSG